MGPPGWDQLKPKPQTLDSLPDPPNPQSRHRHGWGRLDGTNSSQSPLEALTDLYAYLATNLHQLGDSGRKHGKHAHARNHVNTASYHQQHLLWCVSWSGGTLGLHTHSEPRGHSQLRTSAPIVQPKSTGGTREPQTHSGPREHSQLRTSALLSAPKSTGGTREPHSHRFYSF